MLQRWVKVDDVVLNSDLMCEDFQPNPISFRGFLERDNLISDLRLGRTRDLLTFCALICSFVFRDVVFVMSLIGILSLPLLSCVNSSHQIAMIDFNLSTSVFSMAASRSVTHSSRFG